MKSPRVKSEGGNSFEFHIIGGGKEDLTVEGGGSGSVSGGFYPAGTPHYKLCKKTGEDCSIVIFQTETGALAKDVTEAPESDEKDDGKDAIDGKRRGKTIK